MIKRKGLLSLITLSFLVLTGCASYLPMGQFYVAASGEYSGDHRKVQDGSLRRLIHNASTI